MGWKSHYRIYNQHTVFMKAALAVSPWVFESRTTVGDPVVQAWDLAVDTAFNGVS